MSNSAFARSAAMFASIKAAIALTRVEQEAALKSIGPYRSRGHGEGLPGNKYSARRVAMDKRDARKARNRQRS